MLETNKKLELKNYLQNKEKELSDKIIKNAIEKKSSDIEFKQLEIIKEVINICVCRNRY